LKGKVVLLNFFAHWCGSCSAEAPRLQKDLWQPYKDKGVAVIGISVMAEGDPMQRAREFKRKHNLTYPILVDAKGKVAEVYNVDELPTNVVIGKDGKIRYLKAGFDEKGLKQAIKASLLALANFRFHFGSCPNCS